MGRSALSTRRDPSADASHLARRNLSMTTITMSSTPSITSTAALHEIEAELCTLQAAIATNRARMIALISEVDATGAWMATGATSTADWLVKLLDLDVATAREQARVARALRALPLLAQALSVGELSYAKARSATRIATPSNEAAVLAIATQQSAAALPAALAAWQQGIDPAGHRERQIIERGLTARTAPSGNRVFTIELPPESGALFEAALDAQVRVMPVADAPTGAAAGSAHPTLAQQRADAFVTMLDQMLDHHAPADASGSATRHRRPAKAANASPRVELTLHRRVGEEALLDGQPLPEAARRLLTCDCDIRIMHHYPDGSPADLGRKQRLVSNRLRRIALERAGGTCEHPGCTARHFLQAHHIVHWERGGRTDLANLRMLCSLHHRHEHVAEQPTPAWLRHAA
jgi:hypothetical protein